ncbi:MAG: dienelactone hydrolase family protein, partial [Planctomycetota bacterium]
LFVVLNQQLTSLIRILFQQGPGLLLVLSALLMFSCRSSHPMGTPLSASPALQRYDRKIIPRINGTSMECYLSKAMGETSGSCPLLFLCQGSGYGSVFESLPMGGYIDTFGWIWEFSQYSTRFRIAFSEKQGVRIGTILEEADEADPPMEFLIHDTLENRVSDVVRSLEELVKDPALDRSRIVVAGFGEGAQVAAAAARRCGFVTHLGFFACGGEPHLNEIVLLNREKLKRAKITPDEAEEQTNDFFEELAEAFESRADVETLFAGASYAHLISFWLAPPVQDLLALDIPIYAAAGNMDPLVPAASVDLIRLAFLREGRQNLTLKIYPGLDHGFRSVIDEAQDPRLVYQLPAVFDAFCRWILNE